MWKLDFKPRTDTAPDKDAASVFFERMEPKILLSADALSGLVSMDPFSDDGYANAGLNIHESAGLLNAVYAPAANEGDDPPVTPEIPSLQFDELKAALEGSDAQNDAPTSLDSLEAMLDGAGTQEDRQEIILVDAATPDYQQLLSALDTDAPGTDYQIFILQSDRDGIEQITEVLDGFEAVDAIHLLSHGNETGVQLGNSWLGQTTLDQYAEVISGWSKVLTEDADLLIYGCNLAANASGQQLIGNLADLTSADVAASDDLTGAAELNGDWDLEHLTGQIETSITFNPEVPQNWNNLLAVDPLWLSTTGAVTSGGQPGTDTWDDEDIIGVSDPNLAFEPGGTNGTFSIAFDTTLFAAGSDLNANHYVSNNLTVGSSAFQLEAGDVLFSVVGTARFTSGSTPADAGFTNDLWVDPQDVAVFRPDVAGDYSAGTFAMLLEDPSGTGDDITGISLIEQNVTVGDADLQAGDFLFTRFTAPNANQVWLFETDDVGAGTTAGTASVLLEGSDANVSITQEIYGIDVVETTVFVGDRLLDAGTLLITTESADTVGSNNLSVADQDVFALDVTATTLIAGSGNGAATASTFFDGSDVGFNTGAEGLRSVTLTDVAEVSPIQTVAPATESTNEDTALVFSVANGNEITVGDGTAGDPILRTTLAVDNGTVTLATTAGLTSVTGDGTDTVVMIGLESDINAALDGLTFSPTADYNGPADLKVTSDLQADLLGSYDFEVNGDLGNDTSPNGTNDGAVVGATQIIDGNRGNVLQFDGNDAITIPGTFGDPQELTLAAWVQLDAAAGSGEVISLGNRVILRLDFTPSSLGVFGSFWDGSNYLTTSSGTFIAGTGWHHVAYTLDGTTNEQILYIDGIAVDTTTHAAAVNYAGGSGSSALGSHTDVSSYFLEGEMDDARIYDRALSGAEIIGLATDATSDTATVNITVDPVNDAPTISTSTYDFGSIDEDTTTAGVQVSTIVSSLSAGDPDGDAVGMAVTTASGNGTWQFSIDSTDGSDGSWTDFGSVATNNALLLSDSSWVRYQPDGDNGENVGIDFHAWDGTTGSASTAGSPSNADPDGGGGIKAFSTNTADASLVVTDLNDAPSALNLTSTSTYNEGDASVAIDDIIVSDVDNTENVGVTLTLNDTTTGSLSANDGAVYNPGNGEWTIFGTLSAVNNALANMVFNPNINNDQDTTISVEIDDGDEDSSAPLTGTITLDVTPINDPVNVNTTGNTVTFTEDAGPTTALFSAGIDTIETGDTISQLVLTLANVEAGDTLLFGATSIDLNSNGVSGPDGAGFSYTVSSAGASPVLTISSAGVDDATVNAMLNSLVFNNTTNNDPSTSARTVTLTSVTDSGSGTTADGTVATVNVTAVNDGPSITSTAPTTATEDTLYTYTPTVVDVDDANDGTNLTWSLSGQPAGMTVSSTGVVSWTPVNGVTTSGAVTLTVQDGGEDGAVAATEIFTIAVTPVNDGPSITSTAPTTATEDTLYTYTPTVVDVDDANDGTNLTWSLSGQPAGMTVSSTGVVSWTPVNGVTTSGAVTLTVQDGGEDGAVAATEIFTIAVTPVNDGPSITSTAPTTATEDTLYTYTPTVVDVDDANDGTNLTWSLSGQPAGMTVSSTGVVSWTPVNGVTTSGAVTLTVQDGGEDGAVAATEIFTIAVTPVNDGPSITSTAPTTATEDTLYTYTPTVVDVDDANDGTNLTWSLSGQPAGMTVSSTGVVSWTPVNGVTTSGAVTLTVQDGGEDGAVAATEIFTIAVTAVNDGPSITSTAPTTATEDTLYTYTPTVVDVDDANDGTNLTWSLSGQPAGMTVSSTGVVSWTPVNGVTTSGAVTLTVQDGGEDGAVAATEIFTIAVTAVNDGPSITSTAPTTATEDTLYTYTPTVVDVDDANDGTNLTWSLSGQPAGMTVSSTGVVSWTPVNGVTTSGAVTLTVQDGGEDGAVAATEIFTIAVTPVNDGPSITSTAPTTATEDTLYTYTPTVVDVDDANDGTNLTWSLSGQPAGMTVSSTGVVSWTPVNGVTTSGAVTLTVQDGGEDGAVAATEIFTIAVTAVNDGPSITSTAPTTATEDTLYTYTPTVVDVDDANDGTNLTWSLSGQPAGMTVSSTGVVSWTPVNGVTTSGAVTLTVQDGGEDGAVAATEIFTIAVTAVNDGPSITSTAPTTATEDTLYTYTPTVVDVDDANDGTNLTWSLSGQPAGMTVSSTGVVSWTPVNGVTTSGAVTLTVQDGGEDGAVAATEIFTIAVTPVNDGPSITSTAPTTATEDTLYTYTPTVVDVDDANDGTNLTWSLSGQPAGMTVSSTGVVSWTPVNGVTTSGAVTLTVQDGGEDGAVAATEIFTIAVTAVNDGPSITSTAPTTATEDTLYTYTPTVVDVDDANDGTNLTWSLSGQPAGMTVSSTGVVSWTPVNGVTTSGAVTLTVQDGGEDGAVAATEIFTIAVTAVNDGPSITSTAPTTATEDTLYTYTPTVVDVDDANDGTNLTWSLSGQPAGMTVSSTGVVSWTPVNGVTTSGAVTLTVQDGGEDGAVAATEIFTIAVTPVNDAPSATNLNSTSAYTEGDASVPITDIVVSDVDTAEVITATLTLADTATGSPSANDGATYDGLTGVWTITDTVANVNTALANLVFNPLVNNTLNTSVAVDIDDGDEDGSGALTGTIDLDVTPVNDPPTATNLNSTSAYNEGDASVPITDIVVSDIDAGEIITATLTLTDTATGSLSANDGAAYDGLTGIWTITDTVANVNAALANLVFNPTLNNEVDTTISVSIDDGDEDGSGALTGTIDLDVTPVNDAPTATDINSASNYNQGDASLALNDIVIADVDSGETITATLTLANVSSGSLSANNGATYNATSGVWTITGTVAQVNTALANLEFMPAATNTLDTTIAVGIDDGDEDNGGPLIGAMTITVNPLPVVETFGAEPSVVETPPDDPGEPEIEIPPPEPFPETHAAEPPVVETPADDPGELEIEIPPSEPPAEAPVDEQASKNLDEDILSDPGYPIAPVEAGATISVATVDRQAQVEGLPARDYDNDRTRAVTELKPEGIDILITKLTEQLDFFDDPLQLIGAESFITRLNDMREELITETEDTEKVVGSSLTVTAGLSVGYVVWLARSGILLSSVLSSLPAWQLIDPLPVLGRLQDGNKGDEESLESMVEDKNLDEKCRDEAERSHGSE